MRYGQGLHESRHFQLEKLADGVYAAIHNEGGWAFSNAGIIDLGDLTVIFDTFLTPRAAEALRNSAEALTGKPVKIVINSHYHNDHVWGNQVFRPQAEIISSEQTSQLISTLGKEEYREHKAQSLERLKELQAGYHQVEDYRKKDVSQMINYYQGLVDSFPWLKVYIPTLTFGKSMRIHGGKRIVELHAFSGGHTGSDSILVLPDEHIIFMGDLLFTGYHPYFKEGDPQKLLSIYDQIIEFKPEILVPGHGLPGTIYDIANNRDYIRMCFDIAGKFIQQQKSVEDIKDLKIPEAYRKLLFVDYFDMNVKKCFDEFFERVGR